jgi:hypothetical protein
MNDRNSVVADGGWYPRKAWQRPRTRFFACASALWAIVCAVLLLTPFVTSSDEAWTMNWLDWSALGLLIPLTAATIWFRFTEQPRWIEVQETNSDRDPHSLYSHR